MIKPTLPLKGGCQCGALRFKVSSPPLMLYCCHCTNCQKITGSAFVVSATLEESSFSFTRGNPKKTTWMSDSGKKRYGLFCADCGVRLLHGQEPSSGLVSVRAGTFDDTGWLKPSGHIWTRSAQSWVIFDAQDIICDVQPTDYTPYLQHFKRQALFGD